MLPRPDKFVPSLYRYRAGQLLVACGLCVGLILMAGMSWFLVASRHGVIDDAVREMRNDALMLADDEDRLLQAVDVMELGLIQHMREIGVDSPERFEQLMGTQAVHQSLSDRISALPYIGALSLSDRRGLLLNYSIAWPPPPEDNAGRDFIRGLSAAGAPQIFISAPSRGQNSGVWFFHLSRRFDSADGRLIGFVHCTIRIDYAEQFYARLPLTGDGAYSLYRRDGMLIARYPHIDQVIGRTFESAEGFSRMLDALDNGLVRQSSILDGKDRLIVPHALANFPMIVAVSDTMESILGAWQVEARVIIAVTALLLLAIAAAIMAAMRHLRRVDRLQAAEAAQAQARADLALAEERAHATHARHVQEQLFETAVQNMMKGLLMIGHDGNVRVANDRFCELCGLPPDLVTPGMSYTELMRLAVSPGNIQPVDMTEKRHRREEVASGNTHATYVWELSDGRAFTVTHQLLEDGWLTTYEDTTARRTAEAKIAHLASHDALTDLPNRLLFHENLERALGFVRRGSLLALHCVDLDQFKAVNDTLGHPIGDRLLQAVAERLRNGSRETDTVARLGGDEFAIVQTAIGSPLDATELAGRLIDLIEAPFEIDGHHIVIGTSIGITLAPQDGADADQLLKCADLALYRAKMDGRGVYRLFQAEMDAAMQARRILELDLRLALSAGQLELFYQPQINLGDRQVAGCEALLRWRHPTKGLIAPDRFIPLAEETGLIVPIGEWVLRQACAAAAGWPDALRVSVNLSAVQFKSPNLVGIVVDALDEAGLPANRLELEITETVMLQDTDATLATLHELHELGIQIAMDDFGTGYSSLSYLRRFPFNRIKIDQSFVRELGMRDDCIAIVRAVITLGRDLGMAITAEGVETQQQLEMLERAGCAEVQGYLFSRPVPELTVIGLLRSMPAIADVWPPVVVPVPSAPTGERQRLPALSV